MPRRDRHRRRRGEDNEDSDGGYQNNPLQAVEASMEAMTGVLRQWAHPGETACIQFYLKLYQHV